MEIDLTETRWMNALFFAAMLLAALAALGALGRTVTPANGGVLTWTDWQVLQQERAYRRELAQLQQAVDDLAVFYNAGRRDPVRGQYVAAKVEDIVKSQQIGLLADQRQAVMDAAQAVRQWSLGVADDDDVRNALERAADAVANR